MTNNVVFLCTTITHVQSQEQTADTITGRSLETVNVAASLCQPVLFVPCCEEHLDLFLHNRLAVLFRLMWEDQYVFYWTSTPIESVIEAFLEKKQL